MKFTSKDLFQCFYIEFNFNIKVVNSFEKLLYKFDFRIKEELIAKDSQIKK